jgi:hypothetical protein
MFSLQALKVKQSQPAVATGSSEANRADAEMGKSIDSLGSILLIRVNAWYLLSSTLIPGRQPF